MAIQKTPKTITTKTGVEISTCYCRKCMQILPVEKFYDSIDKGLIDSNGKFSVCKDCIIKIYDSLFTENQSIEKTIYKMCSSLNVKFSNEAMDATKLHINTLLSNGKKVNAIFSIFLMKLTATNPSMNKSTDIDLTYSDIGTIFTEKQIDIKEIPIPREVVDFWGDDITEEEILFLEKEYAELKQTHKTDTRAEVILLKEVCYTLWNIKKERQAAHDTSDLIKELQSLMKNLAISPNVVKANALNAGGDSFGQWIEDIERSEPSEWLRSDFRGQIYRDVSNTEEYFQKYIVRPLRNFLLQAKDFNTDENEEIEKEFDNSEINNFSDIDDGKID